MNRGGVKLQHLRAGLLFYRQLPASAGGPSMSCSWLIRFPFQDNKISAVIPREVAESMRRSMRMRRMDCSDYASLRAE